jgi:photosystem II stability/assembly factor-like uncharacterized protein
MTGPTSGSAPAPAPLTPKEASRLLHEAADVVVPAPAVLHRIRVGYRRRRRIRRVWAVAAGVATVAAAVTASLALPLTGHPGSHPATRRSIPALVEKPPSAAALAAATAAGERAERREAGAPVAALGTLGPEGAWVLDGNGLFRTGDGGRRWARITPPVSDPLASIFGVALSGARGWAIVTPSVSGGVSVDRTVNGGRSWQAVPLPAALPRRLSAASISFAGTMTGFAAVSPYPQSHAQIFATGDGGAHWHLVTGTAPPVGSGIEFTSAEDGWGLGPTGRLYRTTDGGLTWAEVTLPGFESHGPRTDPHATGSASLPAFFGASGILLVRGPGTAIPWAPTLVETTGDGGRTWHAHSLPFDPDAPHYGTAAGMPFAAASPEDWLYFGSSELGRNTYANVLFLRVTRDGGRSWTTILPNLGVTGVQSLHFATSAVGWAVVSACTRGCQRVGGLLLRTTDGGQHFTPIRPPG